MDNQNGGQQLSSAQKQQQTAAALARQKLIEAYQRQASAHKGLSEEKPAMAKTAPVGPIRTAQTAQARQEAAAKPVASAHPTHPAQAQAQQARPAAQQDRGTMTVATPQIKTEDWRKYHSAWQDYYQKYYGAYYGKAAQEYIAKERLKYERNAAEKERREAEERKTITSNAQASKEVQDDFKSKIQQKVAKRAKKMRKSRHFLPITIGVVILLLGLAFQYNQVIVANVVAYMSPGGSDVNDITAIDPTVSTNVHDKPTLMIPKLNVEVPVKFGSKNDVKSMNIAMSNGVAHFAVNGAAAMPGEIGNFVVSGHSAGNIYQQSEYKFIFSGLTRMVSGDLIYMDYEGQRYTYRVVGTRVVDPSNVQALRDIATSHEGKPMITLITCTPLGTSKQRLLVYGEQIHPSYEGANEAVTQVEDEGTQSDTMPKNEDSPLEQFWKWLTGQD